MVSFKSIFNVLALAAVIQADDAPYIHIKNTQPPADFYVTHCSVIIDGNLAGCQDASSDPFTKSCGHNSGTGSKEICDTAEITVNWDTLEVSFRNDQGDTGSCTLPSADSGSGCYVTNVQTAPQPNCKAVGTYYSGMEDLIWGSVFTGGAVVLYKDGKEVGHSSAKQNPIDDEWMDIDSELPWVFEWKGNFGTSWNSCSGKYADQTELFGVITDDIKYVVLGTEAENYCEISFHC